MTESEERIAIALAIMDSEAMMWLMVGANHQESWLKDIRKVYKRYKELGGGYGRNQSKN